MKKTLTFVCTALCLFAVLAFCAGALSLESVETAGQTAQSQSAALAADPTVVYIGAADTYAGVPAGATVDVGKTEAVYDAVNGTVTGSGYAGPVTVTAEDGTVTTVVFCGPTKWKPGLNLLTGTEEEFTVDSADAIALTFSTSKTGVQRGTIEQAVFLAGGTNYALKLTRPGEAAAVTVYTKNDFTGIEKARPIQISFHYSRTGTYAFYTVTNATTSSQYKPVYLDASANPSSLIWKSIGAGTATTDSCPDVITSLALQAQHNAADSVTYLDNIEYIPYYKITYHMSESSESNEYVLYQSGTTTRLSEYTVKTDNYPSESGKICLGWSTEQDGEPVSTVPLANADVDLYPVWINSNLINTDPVYIDASSSYTLTVLNPTADIRWTVDVGESEAVFNETTLTLTGAGYAGKVTVTATADDISETKSIYLCAPTKWKPGLNILTGTAAPFDMESEEAVNLTFVTNKTGSTRGGFEVVEYPADSGNRALHLTNSSTSAITVYTKNDFDFGGTKPIEAARSIQLSFSAAKKTSTAMYSLINGTTGTQYWGLNITNTASDALQPFNYGANVGSSRINSTDNVKSFGLQAGPNGTPNGTYLDNIAYIPYYKITYIGFDGTTVAATDYVLYDEAGNLLTSYTVPENTVSGATGYYLDSALTERVTAVALEHKDVTLYAGNKREMCYRVGAEETLSLLSSEGESYTLLLPSEVFQDASDANFVAWVDQNGETYPAHSVVSAADVTDKLVGAVLTAYYQDASKPAMGYAFEGNAAARSKDAAFKYQETMTDDGSTVLHLHQFGAVNASASNTSFKNDNRVFFYGSESFDPSEYTKFVYRYKVNNVTNTKASAGDPAALNPKTDTTAVTSGIPLRIFFFISSASNGYIAGGVRGVDTSASISVSNDYTVYEKDMSATADWTSRAGVYGFALDPARATFSSDVYIDYIRVYRKGITTVTYDTNAPEGYADMVKKEVAPDTGRGVGTGYLLTGEKPEIDGMFFLGWALTPDAGIEDVVDSIDLTGDTTVYAVWGEQKYLPSMNNELSIRSGSQDVSGLRFRATISADSKAFVEEYGFLVTREVILNELAATPGAESELTFGLRQPGTQNPAYVTGVAYKKGEKDVVYSIDASGRTTFTAVCVNIPSTAYQEKIVARTYMKYLNGSGNAITLYGNSVSGSIYEVAAAIKQAGGEDYTQNKTYIDEILGE
ncbi:MAG: hypothetical protein ACI4RV_07920 [Eubacteriales bacterium]